MALANDVGAALGPGNIVAGRYALVRALGTGGDGTVFLAHDRATGDRRVVKVFARRDEATWRRVQAQVAALAGLNDSHIAEPVDVVAQGAAWVLILVWRDGEPLSAGKPLRERADGRSVLGRWAWQLAETLARLHDRGLVHGDLAPGNVIGSADGQLTLIDFAFPDGGGAATGTLGFAAPEALAGAAEPASDLFSLAALLLWCWRGRGPFTEGKEGAAALLRGVAPDLGGAARDLGEGWTALLKRLLSSDARQRPTARALLGLLKPLLGDDDPRWDLAPPSPTGDPTAAVFVGREELRERLVSSLQLLAGGSSELAVSTLTGPRGSGRRSLARRAIMDFRLAWARRPHGSELAPIVWQGTARALCAWAGLDDAGPTTAGPSLAPRGPWMPGLVRHLEREAAQRPLLVVLDDDEDADADALATFLAGSSPSVPLRVWRVSAQAISTPFAELLAVPPLGPADVSELVDKTLGPGVENRDALVATLLDRSGGHAGTVTSLWRAALLRGAGPSTWSRALASTEQGSPEVPQDMSEEMASRLLDQALRAEAAPAGAENVDAALRVRGWLSATVPPRVAPAAFERALSLAAESPALRAGAVAGASHPQAPPLLAARTWERLGSRDEGAALLRAAVDRLSDGSARQGGSLPLLMALAAMKPSSLSVDERGQVATAWAERGSAGPALRLLETSAADLKGELTLAERRAWILARLGRSEEGCRELGAVLDKSRGSEAGEAWQRASGRQARLLLSRGALDEVIALVPPSSTDAVALEALLLAHGYRGEPGRAGELIGRLRETGAAPARVAFLSGLVAQWEGDARRAAAAYADAATAAREIPDLALEASATLNEGLARAELGQFDVALARLSDAVRDLGRLGAKDELAVALFNAGSLQLELGRLEAARRALAALPSQALRPLLEARLHRLAGEPRIALSCLEKSVASESASGLVAEERARLRRELRALLGEAPSPERGRRPGTWQELPPDDLLSEGLVKLSSPGLGDAPLAQALRELAEGDQRAGRLPRALRAAVRAAKLWHEAKQPSLAEGARRLARDVADALMALLPADMRGEMMRDPEVSWAATSPLERGDGETIARLAKVEAQLRRLLRINKRLNAEPRLPRMLELIVDTVIELTDAERGLLLLEDDEGTLQVRVARNIDQETLQGDGLAFSRSIAAQVRELARPIVTLDASGDPRFREAVSVSDLHLRSVLAVPLSIKGKTAGAIYVDHRVRRGVFRDEDVALVADFAEQAALALENARLMQELRRREREVDALNQQLSAELAARKEELRGLEVELRENREALSLRYDYGAIVGRTPAMLEVFRLLDRLTDTQLPVVIQGESGTGKELVARALHFNGPRRGQPFVSESCAALPETLLESTLFGYVRGAFTGADQDRRGLFEVADGGTLFLDEVGEMSPLLQGKLLRVLQEGEFRRVGSEKVRKVNVRIVAATNRDLGRMVQEGRFRQDLFYRLNVARILLPPLRERREDIPAMIVHLLEKHRGEKPVRTIEPTALVALTAYHWPGNVRELENEILRATAFAEERITVADLSPHVAGALLARKGQGEGITADDLALKPRVEALERALIQQALERHTGNQTRAAESLGLSRFGLQKKLQRYGIPAREHHN